MTRSYCYESAVELLRNGCCDGYAVDIRKRTKQLLTLSQELAMLITIQYFTGEVGELHLAQSATISDLKQCIERQWGVPIAVQILSTNGTGAFPDECIVGELALYQNSLTVHLRWEQIRVHCPNERRTVVRHDKASPPGLFVFDLDDTLTVEGVMTQATRRCLQKLYDGGQKLAVASFNLSAVEFLQEANALELFDVVVCGFYAGARKPVHFKRVMEHMEGVISPSRSLVHFFDDQIVNCSDVRQEFPGTVCVHVTDTKLLPMLIDKVLSYSIQSPSSRPTPQRVPPYSSASWRAGPSPQAQASFVQISSPPRKTLFASEARSQRPVLQVV